MDGKKSAVYDAVVVFDTPIKIQNDRKETIQIFGLLYERDMRKRNDLFVWSVQRYITYLMGCQQVQEKGGKLSPEIWMLPNEHIITLGNPVKNFIYKFLKPQLIKYRLVEFEKALDVKDDEHDDLFLISEKPLTRYDLAANNTKITKKQKWELN